jgi:hypothetical protein
MVSSPRAEKKKKARLTLRSGEKDIADLARKSNEQAATEERLWDRLEGKRSDTGVGDRYLNGI